jgi:hypothetical protein
MYSRFLHISHILYFSVIDESHSLMWCLMCRKQRYRSRIARSRDVITITWRD